MSTTHSIAFLEGTAPDDDGLAAVAAAAPSTSANPSDPAGIDWNIEPSLPAALEKFTFWKTIAEVLMYAGYAIAFLTFVVSVVLWLGGGKIFGRHVAEESKSHLLKAVALGIFLGSCGAIWSWLIS